MLVYTFVTRRCLYTYRRLRLSLYIFICVLCVCTKYVHYYSTQLKKKKTHKTYAFNKAFVYVEFGTYTMHAFMPKMKVKEKRKLRKVLWLMVDNTNHFLRVPLNCVHRFQIWKHFAPEFVNWEHGRWSNKMYFRSL